ncbi:hypothetical protein COU78_01665 [Candidatus Peregrinibacteria bacterium CG10_big_fil_rev_8_21_14_0_10_49_24]|nr:MAG: hypothetical protein COV83_00300 [Candidatus Peregrinibacteria bacterium CG11_big_fil_rev_8_21_14_0_20_49_14]PIR51429.1 MAG: hypothetical protein COU78_01665 [Candidatus Peregrinibacteria bacterium CG10_big_fil_rev_8_21_14_0_10_49_24]PJA67365.1 MAG: hypothetical protein CO157_04895 [Candidatus Peregrinibacteria bacterium CG_4_9_14_3_um_filter_49_12]
MVEVVEIIGKRGKEKICPQQKVQASAWKRGSCYDVTFLYTQPPFRRKEEEKKAEGKNPRMHVGKWYTERK